MGEIVKLSRREFLVLSGGTAGALILGFQLGCGSRPRQQARILTNVDAWLEITPDNRAIVHVPWQEMGQGVQTSIPMMLAEELEADWEAVEVRSAHNDPRFGLMNTGGSNSVRQSWEPVRRVGAAARLMLIAAAARAWDLDPSALHATDGRIWSADGSRVMSFGEAAGLADGVPVPEEIPLKPRAEHRLIGQSVRRKDLRPKITGDAVFGCDVRVEGMVRAVVSRCPVFGGSVRSYDAARALQVPGVRQVLEISNGVAVLADTTWAALQGREVLDINWDEGPHADLDSEAISARLMAADPDRGYHYRGDWDVDQMLASCARDFAATYEFPFLAQNPMEPMNCTARIADGRCEVWVPTQAVTLAEEFAARAAGLPRDKVTIRPTLLGGGFGRRLEADYVREAVEIAKLSQLPVQLVFSREDEMAAGFYRPVSVNRLRAGADTNGDLVAWFHHLAAPSIAWSHDPRSIEDGRDDAAVDGAADLPYGIPNVRVTYSLVDVTVPVGPLRSVYNTQNALANECFLDEIATGLQRDPVSLRLALLGDSPRLAATLREAAKRWEWPRELPEGHGQGVACHGCYRSYVTTIAEVVADGDRISVVRILSAIDCGPIVHPDGLVAQVEGAVALALSNLLREEITISGGRAIQRNYDRYPMLRFDEMPEVEVVLMDNDERIGGGGEPGYPPVGPAVLNAVHDATGIRVRKLPLAQNFRTAG